MVSKKVKLLSAIISSMMVFGTSSGVSRAMVPGAGAIVEGIAVNAGTNAAINTLGFLGRKAWDNKGKIILISAVMGGAHYGARRLTKGNLYTFEGLKSLVGLGPYAQLKGKDLNGLNGVLSNLRRDEKYMDVEEVVLQDLINLVANERIPADPNYRVTKKDIYAVLTKYPDVLNWLKSKFGKVKSKLSGNN